MIYKSKILGTNVNATKQRLKINYGGSTRGTLRATKNDIVPLEKLWKASQGVVLTQGAERKLCDLIHHYLRRAKQMVIHGESSRIPDALSLIFKMGMRVVATSGSQTQVLSTPSLLGPGPEAAAAAAATGSRGVAEAGHQVQTAAVRIETLERLIKGALGTTSVDIRRTSSYRPWWSTCLETRVAPMTP